MANSDEHALLLDIGARLTSLEKGFDRAAGVVRTRSKQMVDDGTRLEKFFGKPSLGKALDKTFDATRFKILDSGAARVGLMGGALESLGASGLVAAAGVGAAIAAFAGAREAAKFADDINDTANRLHVTTDALQEYRYAIRAAGGEEKGADEALENFSSTLGKASEGLPKALRAFKELFGQSFTAADVKRLGSTEQALEKVTKAMEGLSNEQKDALVDQFGLAGLKPLVEGGLDAMIRLRREAQKLGIVMDADLVKRGGELNDQFETVSRVIDVQLKSALVDLGPVLLSILRLVGDLAKAAAAVADSFRSIQTKSNAGLQSRAATLAKEIEIMRGAQSRGAGVSQKALDSKVAELNQIQGVQQQRAADQKPPPIKPTKSLTDLSKTKSGPRDDTEQRTQAVLATLDNAEREVLQAMLSLATSTEARANLERQIAQKEADAATARLDKEIADVGADKGLSAAKKAALVGQLEIAKQKTAEASRLKQQAIDAAAADAIARERLEQAQTDRDGEAELLQLQSDLTFSERTRAAISLRLVELAYEREKAELEGIIASRTAADADKEIARRKLATLNATQPGRVEQTRRNASEPQRQVGQIVGGIKQRSNSADDARQMYAEIDRLRQADVISEREAAQAKAEVNARYHEARLNQASEFFGNLATLSESSNKTLHAIGKAAAVAQATIDGILAVQKALASAPPPFNYALAAVAGVAAAVNVAKIAGLKDGGQVAGPGGPRDDKVLRWLSNGEHVVNSQAASKPGVRPLLEALNAGIDLRAMLPAPAVVTALPAQVPAPAGGDFHLHNNQTISVPSPDLEALIRRSPRVLVGELNRLIRNGEIKLSRP